MSSTGAHRFEAEHIPDDATQNDGDIAVQMFRNTDQVRARAKVF